MAKKDFFSDYLKRAEQAYLSLKQSRQNYFVAVEDVIQAQESLSVKESVALSEGKIEGSNKEKREAALALMFAEQYRHIERLQADERLAKHYLDMAQLEVDNVRLVMRVHELAFGVIPNEGH